MFCIMIGTNCPTCKGHFDHDPSDAEIKQAMGYDPETDLTIVDCRIVESDDPNTCCATEYWRAQEEQEQADEEESRALDAKIEQARQEDEDIRAMLKD
ncbi:MAG: hypothetical protein PHT54_00530 [Candidatus Nanoarchaeia archaeon]|nr:hypothetical protein [Candidatus Nanoarchaeia archaeon]